jgi:hypothetical protein
VEIKSFFDQKTATLTYELYESASGEAVIIDPVLGYDQSSGMTDVPAIFFFSFLFMLADF